MTTGVHTCDCEEIPLRRWNPTTGHCEACGAQVGPPPKSTELADLRRTVDSLRAQLMGAVEAAQKAELERDDARAECRPVADWCAAVRAHVRLVENETLAKLKRWRALGTQATDALAKLEGFCDGVTAAYEAIGDIPGWTGYEKHAEGDPTEVLHAAVHRHETAALAAEARADEATALVAVVDKHRADMMAERDKAVAERSDFYAKIASALGREYAAPEVLVGYAAGLRALLTAEAKANGEAMGLLLAERDAAVAACAAMRAALVEAERALNDLGAWARGIDDCVRVRALVRDAIAPDVGRGWVSPALAEQMADLLRREAPINTPADARAFGARVNAVLAAYDEHKRRGA